MAQTNLNIPPAATWFVDKRGVLNPAWYRYLVGLQTTANGAAAGEVETALGSGLQGGGAVADGISLSIAPDGVTDTMLRPSLGCSVIGRFVNSTGNPADIQAAANDRILGRFGDQLVFKEISLLGLGTVTTVSVATANGVSGSVANPTSTPAITLTLGAITPTSVAATTWIKTTPKTVGTLIAAATAGAGARDFVTDATAPAFGVAVVGGGAVSVPVYSDGANWLVG